MSGVLKILEITSFRNIQKARMHLDKGVNVFYGRNASGKTSVLESLHLFSHGKSFRCADKNLLIQNGKSDFLLQLNILPFSGVSKSLRLHKPHGLPLKGSLDGQLGISIASMAKQVPAIFMGPDFHRRFLDTPATRRKMINWLLFHVEHQFPVLWSTLEKAVKSRNHLIKQHASNASLCVWEEQIALISQNIMKTQSKWIREIKTELDKITSAYDFTFMVDLYPGWEISQALSLALESTRINDGKRGYTSLGSHRFDLKLRTSKGDARFFCSEGESKKIAYFVIMAIATVYKNQTGKHLIFMLDDWGAELDQYHESMIADFMTSHDFQVLISTICPNFWRSNHATMFHVEQGVISQQG